MASKVVVVVFLARPKLGSLGLERFAGTLCQASEGRAMQLISRLRKLTDAKPLSLFFFLFFFFEQEPIRPN